MKRVLALILALAICLSLCACGAPDSQSNAEHQSVTVYAQVPADWANPGCWAWSTVEGVDAFDAWPGMAMTKTGDWYAIEVPHWVNYIIINGNEGAVQTADLPVETGRNVWVVVTDAKNASVFYEEPVIQAVPENVTVHAKVPSSWFDPRCWAWSSANATDVFDAWPGDAMRSDGQWYTISVPNWVDYVIINSDGGSVQTADLPVESGKDIWVVVHSDLNAKVFYAEPSAEELNIHEHQMRWEVSAEDSEKMVGTCTICGESCAEAMDRERIGRQQLTGSWKLKSTTVNGMWFDMNLDWTLEFHEDGTFDIQTASPESGNIAYVEFYVGEHMNFYVFDGNTGAHTLSFNYEPEEDVVYIAGEQYFKFTRVNE